MSYCNFNFKFKFKYVIKLILTKRHASHYYENFYFNYLEEKEVFYSKVE